MEIHDSLLISCIFILWYYKKFWCNCVLFTLVYTNLCYVVWNEYWEWHTCFKAFCYNSAGGSEKLKGHSEVLKTNAVTEVKVHSVTPVQSTPVNGSHTLTGANNEECLYSNGKGRCYSSILNAHIFYIFMSKISANKIQIGSNMKMPTSLLDILLGTSS